MTRLTLKLAPCRACGVLFDNAASGCDFHCCRCAGPEPRVCRACGERIEVCGSCKVRLDRWPHRDDCPENDEVPL